MAKPYLWLKAVVLMLAVCLLPWDAGLATGSPGYLPVVGPVPVRFQTPLPAVSAMVWPPLRQAEMPTAKTEAQLTNAPVGATSPREPSATALPASATAAGSAAALAPAPHPDMIVPFPVPASSLPGSAAEGVVDPQVLLSYLLSISTNEPGAKVIMPIFVPPTPPAPSASSHATYESR